MVEAGQKHTFMKSILATGLSGMIGSCIQDTLDTKYTFQDISLDTGVDIRNYDNVKTYIEKSDSEIVLHLAAKADVDLCQKDMPIDKPYLTSVVTDDSDILIDSIDPKKWQYKNTAFAVNVVGTVNIARACKEFNKKLILISTDFVFSGDKKDPYVESDEPHPVNYYGQTKLWAEKAVSTIRPDSVIVRITYPYGTHHPVKQDFIRILIERLKSKKPIMAIFDQLFMPTYVPDIAAALDQIISMGFSGEIFHVVGSEAVSAYETAVALAKKFGYDSRVVEKTTAREYYRGRARRAQYLHTSNEKIKKLGISMKSFHEGLAYIYQ